MPRVTVTVNGTTHEHALPACRLLVEFLRDDLGLTGTHTGCDTAQCGACVVHLGGEPVKACTVLAVEADGQAVTTIEGLAQGSALDVVQQAFADHHGLQCGFCTPGMVMMAAALLKQVPQPTQDEIKRSLDGNICRCTGYQNIVRAVMAASTALSGQPAKS